VFKDLLFWQHKHEVSCSLYNYEGSKKEKERRHYSFDVVLLLPQAGGSSRQLDRHVRFLSVRAPVDLDTNTDKTRTHMSRISDY
jgi:hypothetical protein